MKKLQSIGILIVFLVVNISLSTNTLSVTGNQVYFNPSPVSVSYMDTVEVGLYTEDA